MGRLHRSFLWIVLFGLLVISPIGRGIAQAADTVHSFGRFARLLVPREENRSVSTLRDALDAHAAGLFLEQKWNEPQFKSPRQDEWIYFHVTPPLEASSVWLIELGSTGLDEFDLYLKSRDGSWWKRSGGDTLPFSAREVANEAFQFRLPDLPQVRGEGGEDVFVLEGFLRVRNVGPVRIPMRLISMEEALSNSSTANLFRGAFLALTWFMAIYVTLFYFWYKKREYLAYVLFSLSFSGFFLCLSGLGARYLWPNHPQLNAFLYMSLSGLIVYFQMIFALEFLDLRKTSPVVARVVMVLAASGIAFTALSILAPVSLAVKLSPFAGIPSTSLLFISFYLVKKRVPQARLHLAGLLAYFLGFLAMILYRVGFVFDSPAFDSGPWVGALGEMFFFYYAIADRVKRKILSEEHARAEREQLHAAEKIALERDAALAQVRTMLSVADRLNSPMTTLVNFAQRCEDDLNVMKAGLVQDRKEWANSVEGKAHWVHFLALMEKRSRLANLAVEQLVLAMKEVNSYRESTEQISERELSIDRKQQAIP